MPRKGYTPQTSRPKFPLTVVQQKQLLEVVRKKGAETQETLLLLMLSTGMHPKVLAKPEKYHLEWNENYLTWHRPKTHKTITTAWSKAMKSLKNLDERMDRLVGSTRQYYHQMLSYLGREAGVKGFCPLQARHTNFVNRARLGHNAFDIAQGAATDLTTVYDYYTIGMGESKNLTKEEREWLQWLMEC